MSTRTGGNGSNDASSLPQMLASTSSQATYSPLSELMRAIILRVVDDYNAGGEFREGALEYLDDEDDEYIFAFRSICQHFGIDPLKTKQNIMFPPHRIATRRRAS
jgi:hypothetical protein